MGVEPRFGEVRRRPQEVGGLATELNGYSVQRGFGLYATNGTTTDHDHDAHGTMSWTPEIGDDEDGFWPATTRIVPLAEENLDGPVNAVAPQPVTNAEFTRTLARVLRRPAFLPLPAWAARAALGEMADALLLSGTRVRPRRLLESGYNFLHPDLEPALRALLGETS